ncbi:hypothetical protein ACIPMW_32305 [Streptomyces sp. NPDC086669]|uniref:hypothetical protein n=1 Tax=Streptomyces sp. NPDC086669 TaxID=3365753 RepID=UPI003826A7E6
MTAPRPAGIRLQLSPWCAAILRRHYPGQIPAVVLERALRILATADGHLTPDGRSKNRRPT